MCAASEAHAAAFALERRFWNQVGPAAQQLQRQTARASHARPAARAWGRRAFLGTALGGTAAAAIAAVAPPFGLWRSFDEWDADYRTDTGGRRQFGLDRQVQVDMNTQTSIALRPDVAGALGMELITGEAAFEALAPDRKQAGRRRQGQRQPGEVRAASHRQQRSPDLRQRRGRAVARGRRAGPGAAPAGQLRPRAGGRDPDDRPR